MKIIGDTQVKKTAAGRSRKTRETNGEKFVLPEPGAATAPERVQVGTVLAVDGLLAVQEVEADASGRSAGLQLAENLLDALDEVRHGLLLGMIPRDRLGRLLDFARERAPMADPQLAEILQEIELRAAVELAKFEPAAHGPI